MKKSCISLFLIIPLLFASHVNAENIKVLMLKSWGNGTSFYNELASQSLYLGDDVIQYSYYGGEITLATLDSRAPNVLLIANPSGGNKFYSTAERDAIRTYLQTREHAKGLVGEGYVFNSIGATRPKLHFMGDLFGFNGANVYDNIRQDGIYYIQDGFGQSRLFNRLGTPFVSGGFLKGNIPMGTGWDENTLGSAIVMAKNLDETGVVTYYQDEHYNAVYVSVWAGYRGNQDDKQLIYNSLVSAYYGESFLPQVNIVSEEIVECSAVRSADVEVFLEVDQSASDPVNSVTWLLNGSQVGSGFELTISAPLGQSTILAIAETIGGNEVVAEKTILIRDTVPPDVKANVARLKGNGKGKGMAEYGLKLEVSDVCDPQPFTNSFLGSNVDSPVTFRVQRNQSRLELEIEEILLHVDASDESGNTFSAEFAPLSLD